jgi:hypothetical protein
LQNPKGLKQPGVKQWTLQIQVDNNILYIIQVQHININKKKLEKLEEEE